MDNNEVYDYTSAGFDKFFVRGGDSFGFGANSADAGAPPPSTAIPFDRGQQSGSFGNIVRIGNIQIDGINRRISIYDDNNQEVARFGKLGD